MAEDANTAAMSADEKILKLAARLEAVEKVNDQITQRLEKLESKDDIADVPALGKRVELLDTQQVRHGLSFEYQRNSTRYVWTRFNLQLYGMY